MSNRTNENRHHLLRLATVTGAGALLGALALTTHALWHSKEQETSESDFPSLAGANAWLNSPPLTPESLRGKVVLVQFWTFTCINWRRTLPYVRAWAEKYKDKGLVVIGVHTPEFSFEGEVDNVRRETKNLDVNYPVAVDSNYAVWRAFDNHYWPALYFIDHEGHIRDNYFGEGEYEASEMMIQRLLMAAGRTDIGDGVVSVDTSKTERAADWGSVKSPETYVDYGHGEDVASPGGTVYDEPHTYSYPERLRLNQFALMGNWTVTREYAAVNQANGRLAIRFHARDVNLVMGPPAGASPVRFRVYLDGKAPGASHGIEVDAQGNGTATDQRMYQLIRQPLPVTDSTFEIEFLDPGGEAYCFTFG